MKTWRNVLIAAVSVSSMMPLVVGVLATVDQDRLLKMLHLASSADTRALALFFGMTALFVAATGGLTVLWLYRGRREGLTLAYLTGGMLTLCAAIMIWRLPEPGPAFIDLVKGLVLLALAAAHDASRRGANPAPVGSHTMGS